MSMLTNSLKNLVSKPATRLYPTAKFEPVPGLRGHTEYDMTLCIMCTLCSKRCPNDAIETDKVKREHHVNRMKCMACGYCVDACPTDAITMVPMYSAPAYTKTIDTYAIKITEHQQRIAELPPFVREPEPGVEREPTHVPPPSVLAAPAKAEATLRVEDRPISCTMWPISQIMVRNVLSVTPDVRIVDAARMMLENNISGLPVIDSQRRVVGIVTERDIMSAPKGAMPLTIRGMFARLFLHDGQARPGEDHKAVPMEAPVSTIMTSPCITVKEDLTVEDVATLMNEHNINRVPVIGRDNRLAGIVTRSDIVRALTKQPK